MKGQLKLGYKNKKVFISFYERAIDCDHLHKEKDWAHIFEH